MTSFMNDPNLMNVGTFFFKWKKSFTCANSKSVIQQNLKMKDRINFKKVLKKKLKKLTDLYQTFFTTFISTFFLNPFFAKTTRLVKTSFRDCARRCRDHCPAPFSHFVCQKGYFLCSPCSWVLCPPSFKSVPL